MPTATINSTISVAGVSLGSLVTRLKGGTKAHILSPTEENAFPAGKPGTLTTRTDDDTGVATLEADHGITDADTVDVYWSGGMRYGMTVSSVDGTAVSIDLGSGDNLPTETTALVVTARIELDTDVDGDLIELIAVGSDRRGHVEFLTDGDASIVAIELTAGEAWTWVNGQGVSNPLTGDPIGKVQVTNGEATAGTLTVGILYDDMA